jgi:DNA-binding IclR family transcriptional regulator
MTVLDARYNVPALSRGMAVLGQFSRQDRELSGAEIARRLKLPRASVFRMLQTFEQLGFVERVGEGSDYKLSVGVLRLGFEYIASMELTEHGRPLLDALRDSTGYSAHIVVRDQCEVVFVAKATGRSAQFHAVQVGARLPAHATVLGRVLLGGQSMANLAALYQDTELVAKTPATPTTLKALKALVDADALRGWGISQSGYESGICTLAAPVFNEVREVVAAVSITVPAQKIPPDTAKLLAAQVCDAALQLTARISHQAYFVAPQPAQRLGTFNPLTPRTPETARALLA